MISGKKPFIAGKSFQYPRFKNLSDNRKGKPCTKCGRYKKMDQFISGNPICYKCRIKEND